MTDNGTYAEHDMICSKCETPWQEGEWHDAPDWPGHQQINVCPCKSTTFYIVRVGSDDA